MISTLAPGETSVHTILHVGCGGSPLPEFLQGKETRLDISEECLPDIVASMMNMGDIGSFDVVYCSHSLEHLFIHDVKKALLEFKRVLVQEGYALIFVPDLGGVLPTEETLYVSPAGPITGLDLIYGHAAQAEEIPYMAHHCGFTKDTLEKLMQEAGFSRVEVKRMSAHNLMAVGIK